MTSIAALWGRHREEAGLASYSALAFELEVSPEYCRQIEKKGKLPSDALVSKFIRICNLKPPASDDLRQAVVDARITRQRGKNLVGFKGAEQVADAVIEDIADTLVNELGLMADDIEYLEERIRASIVARLR